MLLLGGSEWTTRFSRVSLGGMWVLSFLTHMTLCTSSSPSRLVCGQQPITLLITALIFASLCSVSVVVIVAVITAALSQYRHWNIACTSKVVVILCFSKVKSPGVAVCSMPHCYGNSRAIWDHSVICHPVEVTFPPLPQPFKAGSRFSGPGGMQG